MGNLHAGHVSLLEAARAHGERFVASIFVNPMQFGPNEDFAHYPRTPREDEQLLPDGALRSDVRPGVDEIYPTAARRRRACTCGVSRNPRRRVPARAFRGRGTVVAKLFHIVEPDVAVFGEKDFQQLMVIRRMTLDLACRWRSWARRPCAPPTDWR